MSGVVDAARFFEAIARRYDRAYALDAASTRARMGRVLAELPPRARVLDLGVGTGRELSALQDAGHAPTGLDASPTMLALCARRARPVPLVQGDLWAPLPFPDGAFDAVIALHGTLAHPPPGDEGAHARLRDEIARVLAAKAADEARARGVLIAEVPSPALLDRLDALGAIHVGDMRLRRGEGNRLVHEDLVASVSVEAIVLGPDEWRERLAPRFDARVEPLGALELLVVARRRG